MWQARAADAFRRRACQAGAREGERSGVMRACDGPGSIRLSES
jgi:hypothetical protein